MPGGRRRDRGLLFVAQNATPRKFKRIVRTMWIGQSTCFPTSSSKFTKAVTSSLPLEPCAGGTVPCCRKRNSKHSGFILDYHTPAVLRTVTECLDFLDDFLGKNLIACQFLVAPHPGLLAAPHAGGPLALRLTHAHR